VAERELSDIARYLQFLFCLSRPDFELKMSFFVVFLYIFAFRVDKAHNYCYFIAVRRRVIMKKTKGVIMETLRYIKSLSLQNKVLISIFVFLYTIFLITICYIFSINTDNGASLINFIMLITHNLLAAFLMLINLIPMMLFIAFLLKKKLSKLSIILLFLSFITNPIIFLFVYLTYLFS
jgi:hypothetical protein